MILFVCIRPISRKLSRRRREDSKLLTELQQEISRFDLLENFMIFQEINLRNFDLSIFHHIREYCHIFIVLISCLKPILWVFLHSGDDIWPYRLGISIYPSINF